MKLKIKRKGIVYYLKKCKGGCERWYYTEYVRRCPICGCGLLKDGIK